MPIDRAAYISNNTQKGLLFMKIILLLYFSQNIPEISNEELMQLVEIPPKTDMGDFAFPCFRLAKVYRKANDRTGS